jgi:hypothetical protein
VQVVELSTRVRPTCRFVDAAALVQGVEAGISICLQRALEAGQMRLWMDALAIWRVGE